MKKLVLFTALVLAFVVCPAAKQVHAEELSPEFTLSNGGNKSDLTDSSHYTSVKFNQNDTITITSEDGSPIYGLYLNWDSKPVSWTLTTDSEELACGADGFLHEYIALETPSMSLTIHIPQNSTRVDGIRIFGEGKLPPDVQVWNPPCERADIMVISSHADDEILFMGGVLPTYSYLYDADIQVVYMCEFWSTAKVREHEKLDGLWEAGIRFYPTCGNFPDKYSNNVERARQQYDYESMVSFLVEQIRRFQPQVLVTHDYRGEYGHGFHILTCNALMDAVEFAANTTQYPDSGALYGVWNTPKTYLHIFPFHTIKLDLHIPVEEDYAGRTALDILKAAYKKHVSQQQWSFHVSDNYKHSCADFGLYRTLVGPDTTNDLLCNLKTYKVQEVEAQALLEAEIAALAAQKAEEERLAKEEKERLAALEKAEQERQFVEEQMCQEIIQLKEEKDKLEKKQASLTEEYKKELEASSMELQVLSGQLDSLQTKNVILIAGIILSLLAFVGAIIAVIYMHGKN